MPLKDAGSPGQSSCLSFWGTPSAGSLAFSPVGLRLWAAAEDRFVLSGF